MPSPPFTLGIIIATLYGAAFHLLTGGGGRRLAIYMLSAWMGFGIGHLAGNGLNITFLSLGPLHLFSATLGAFTALLAARSLSPREENNL